MRPKSQAGWRGAATCMSTKTFKVFRIMSISVRSETSTRAIVWKHFLKGLNFEIGSTNPWSDWCRKIFNFAKLREEGQSSIHYRGFVVEQLVDIIAIYLISPSQIPTPLQAIQPRTTRIPKNSATDTEASCTQGKMIDRFVRKINQIYTFLFYIFLPWFCFSLAFFSSSMGGKMSRGI